MGNELIKSKFDDLEGKIDFLIELCQTLEAENQSLTSKLNEMEAELERKKGTEERYSEQEALIQSKIDGLLGKLDGFSDKKSSDDQATV